MKTQSIKEYFSCSGEKYDTSSLEQLIEEFNKGYHYLTGQIVEITLTGLGRIPVVVTKVHQKDINGHYTYDIMMLIGDRMKSTVKSTERYLWRFTETPNEDTMTNIMKLVDVLFDENNQYGQLFEYDDTLPAELCYVSGDNIISIETNLPNSTKILKELDAMDMEYKNELRHLWKKYPSHGKDFEAELEEIIRIYNKGNKNAN